MALVTIGGTKNKERLLPIIASLSQMGFETADTPLKPFIK